MSAYRRQKHRAALHRRQGGLCYWCEKPMRLIHTTRGQPPDDLCTLEHLDDRFDPSRGQRGGEYRKVAACWRCNNDRAKQRQAAQPIEVLRMLSGRRGLDAAKREMQRELSAGEGQA